MNTNGISVLLIGGGVLGVAVWLLHKIGRALATILEVLAAAALVFISLWWLLKSLLWLAKQVVTRWRTSLTVVAIMAWSQYLGWLSLAIVAASVVAVLASWRLLAWCPMTTTAAGSSGPGGCAGRSTRASSRPGCTPAG